MKRLGEKKKKSTCKRKKESRKKKPPKGSEGKKSKGEQGNNSADPNVVDFWLAAEKKKIKAGEKIISDTQPLAMK